MIYLIFFLHNIVLDVLFRFEYRVTLILIGSSDCFGLL